MELRTDTLQGNMGKSSCFKLKPVWQANSFEEIIDRLFSILALGLTELYIDVTNLAFLSSIRCSLSALNRFALRDPPCKVHSV